MQKDRRSFLVDTITSCLVLSLGKSANAGGDTALAERYYDDAVNMLKRGHWYERAIGKLSYCVKVSPESSKYHAALGCAYVSRFASLCEAYINRDRKTLTAEEVEAFFATIRKQVKDGTLQEGDDRDNNTAETSTKISGDSVRLHTSDDNKDIFLSADDLSKVLQNVSSRGLAALEKAVVTAREDSELKMALTMQAYGIRLLRICESGLGSGSVSDAISEKQLTQWQDTAKNAAKRLTETFPNDVSGFLTLGEVLTPFNQVIWKAADDELRRLYETIHRLAPENSSVIFRLYQIARADKKRVTEAENYARQFVALDKGNAYAYFCLAGFLAEQFTPGEIEKLPSDKSLRERLEAIINIVNTGAVCAKYEASTSGTSPVALLRSAYALFGSEGNPSAVSPMEFTHLGSLCTRFAKSATADIALAKRCTYAMLALGKRVMASLPTHEGLIPTNRPSEQMAELTGYVILRVAYTDLLALCKKEDNESEYAAIKKERDTFLIPAKQKRQKYLARSLAGDN